MVCIFVGERRISYVHSTNLSLSWILYFQRVLQNLIHCFGSRWMFKLSEWASFQTYDIGHANAGHILVRPVQVSVDKAN
jgi:hypothetical protein